MEPKPSGEKQKDVFQAEYVRVLRTGNQISEYFASCGKVPEFKRYEDRIVKFLEIRNNATATMFGGSEVSRKDLALFVGASLGIAITLKAQGKMAQGTPAEALMEERARYISFAQLHALRTRVNGVSLNDLDNGVSNPSQALQLLVNIFTSTSTLQEQEYFYSETDDLPTRYPDAYEKERNVARSIQSIFLINSPTVEELKKWEKEAPTQIEKDAFFFLTPLVLSFGASVYGLRSHLIDPKNIREDPELERVLNRDDITDGIVKAAFHQYFMLELDKAAPYSVLRGALTAVRNGICVDFHQKMADFVYETLRRIEDSSIPTIDDLPTILTGEDPGDTDLREIGRIIGDITSKTPGKEFELTSEELPWETLVPSNNVTVNLDSSRPQKFTIKFPFSNEEGEDLNLGVFIDTRKEIFSWTFIESPDDPNMQLAKRHVLRQIKIVFSELYKSVDEEYREKKTKEKNNITRVQPQTKKPRLHRALNGPKRNAIRDVLMTPIKMALSEAVIREDARPQFNIIIPPDDELRKLLGNPTDADFETIRQELERFNTDGPGRKDFRILSSTKTGERLYRYRANAKTPNGYRIILRRVGNGTLEIVNGKPRTDVYKKNRV